MKKLLSILFVSLIINVLLFSQAEKNSEITWYSIEEAVQLSQNNPQKIFVYVFSSNCGWCTRMERNTFTNPVIAEYLNENYYPVKLNSGVKTDIVLGTKTYKFIPANPLESMPAYHELVVTLLNGRLAYPAYAFINEKMAYLGVEFGYQPPEMMEKWLYYIAEEIYIESPGFEEFAAKFKGRLTDNEPPMRSFP